MDRLGVSRGQNVGMSRRQTMGVSRGQNVGMSRRQTMGVSRGQTGGEPWTECGNEP